MSSRKIVSFVLVALLHVALGYAFISGLAFNVIKKVNEDLKTFDVDEEPPPPPDAPPPPPPTPQDVTPPPVVTPPPIVQTPAPSAPVIMDVPRPPPPVIHVEAPPAPPPPRVVKTAGPKGDPAQWVTSDDYPPGAQRDGREGVVAVAWDINAAGRIENCRVTASSGSPDLDETTCRLLTRRGRYSPALNQDGQPTKSTQSRRVRWQLPKN